MKIEDGNYVLSITSDANDDGIVTQAIGSFSVKGGKFEALSDPNGTVAEMIEDAGKDFESRIAGMLRSGYYSLEKVA